MLRRMTDRQSELGPDIVHGLLSEMVELGPDTFTVTRDVMATILDQARRRGELPAADLNPRIVTLPPALLRHEMLLAMRPISDETLVEIVDEIYLPVLRAAGLRDRVTER